METRTKGVAPGGRELYETVWLEKHLIDDQTDSAVRQLQDLYGRIRVEQHA
ncbi:MAG TPA: hypothetical protein VGF89_07100 [Steroidobacteraceae bacterium]|jgi:hypothetical protein